MILRLSSDSMVNIADHEQVRNEARHAIDAVQAASEPPAKDNERPSLQTSAKIGWILLKYLLNRLLNVKYLSTCSKNSKSYEMVILYKSIRPP